MKNLFINILTLTTLLSSVLVITSKNPIISVIFLISAFINAAGYLIMLGIGFIGISYIIVYIGAIAVLFLFVIMMINIKLTDILETGKSYTQNLPLGLSVGLLFIYEFASLTVQLPSQSLLHISEYFSSSFPLYIITYFNTLGSGPQMLPHLDTHHMLQNNNTIVETAFNPNIFDQSIINFTQIQAIGQGLYTYGAFWLILCSIILLLAMVSPIFISKK